MSFQKKEHSIYSEVAASSVVAQDFIPGNGVTFSLDEVGASPSHDDNLVEIIWDADGTTETILSTNAETTQKRFVDLVGDGVKVLRIRLTNNTQVSRAMGAYTIGGLNG